MSVTIIKKYLNTRENSMLTYIALDIHDVK